MTTGEALDYHGLSVAAPTAVDRQQMPGTSLQSRLLAQALRVTVRPVLGVWARTNALPWPFEIVEAVGSRFNQPVAGTRVQNLLLDNCRARWIDASGKPADDRSRVILYLHGGAFLACGIGTHQRLVSQISAAAQAPALMVDYRMLPDHTISDAINDCVDAYRHLLARGYRGDQIVIAGDSAGGYLSFAVPLAIRSLGLPTPAGIAAMSPLTEMSPHRKTEHPGAGNCALFPKAAVHQLTKISARADRRAAHERLCPLDSDLRGLPRTLIQVGSHEMLRSDSELMADRLAEAGVPCELQVWRRQVHAFQAAADLVPEARRAVEEIGVFVRTAVPDRLTVVR